MENNMKKNTLPSIEVLYEEIIKYNTLRPPSVLYYKRISEQNKEMFDSILTIVSYASERGYIQRSNKISNDMRLFYARLYRAGLECCIDLHLELKYKLLRVDLADFEAYLLELDVLMTNSM
jgi:hypothetical protein